MIRSLKSCEIRRAARSSLAGRWNTCAGIVLLFALLSAACCRLHVISAHLCYGICALCLPVLSAGCQWAFLKVSCRRIVRVGDLFSPFGSVRNYFRVLTASVLFLAVVAGGAVMLLLPGIILASGYSMTFFLLRDREDLSVTEAMYESWTMMYGHKWACFRLWMSFLGWFLLAVVSVVGILWFVPYFCTAMAEFYNRIQRCRLV